MHSKIKLTLLTARSQYLDIAGFYRRLWIKGSFCLKWAVLTPISLSVLFMKWFEHAWNYRGISAVELIVICDELVS